MKCENDKGLLTLYINNQMSDAERGAFKAHLTECIECRQELQSTREMWDLMGEIAVPEPSGDMQAKFNALLDDYKTSSAEKKSFLPAIVQKLRGLFTLHPGFAMAYSIVLIMAGVGAGLLINTRNTSPAIAQTPIDSLTKQVREMKEMMTLALLENPSASERIRGVSYVSEIKGTNKNVIDALLSTLNNDPNTNVRLMTLEALTHYANEPAVREGLVQSIAQQDSPLVQSALADAMIKLQEKRSIQPFRKLLQQKDLNIMVRSKIEETITRLI
jgi:hypothetical protein